jgi:translocation and assembly module TamB
VDLDFDVANGAVGGVPFERLAGTAAYADGQLRATVEAALDTAGAMRAEVAVPADFVLGASPSFALRDAGALEGRFVADSLALRPLGELSPRVREVAGRVTGEVSLTGSVDAPQFDGTLHLANGGVTVLALNKRFEQAEGRVVFDGRTARLDALTIRSGGTAAVTGTVTFEELAAPVFALDLALRDFQAVGVSNRDDARLSGDVNLSGPLADPVLTGGVAVHGGYLPVPRFGSRLQELDIYAPPRAVERQDDGGPSFVDALRIRNLTVDVREDAWFQLEEARAQLSGQLTLDRSGDEMRITGTLEGTRGTYVLVAGPIVRQFELVRAEVRFLGSPEPNPALDITARRAIIDPSAQPFEVTVRVGGTLRNPTLGLASAEAPAIPESELLSFLLFGRPSVDVQGSGMPGEDLLEETFWGGFTELLSVELSQGVADQLSLDLLTIRLGGGSFGDFGGATLVLGRELDEDLFLTVESTVGGILQPADAVLNTWAARLEWTFDPRSTLRLGIEPVYRGRLIRGIGVALPNNRSQQQFVLDVRRRWTY